MVGKAVGQVQLTVAEIAPEIDPLAEAARFFGRSLMRRLVNRLDPQELLYQAEKLRYRAGRVADDFTGGRHAPPVTFAIERSLAHAGRTVALGLTVGLSWIAVASSERRAPPPPWGGWRAVVAAASTAALAVEVTGRGVRHKGAHDERTGRLVPGSGRPHITRYWDGDRSTRELRWNGTAWVDPAAAPPPSPVVTPSPVPQSVEPTPVAHAVEPTPGRLRRPGDAGRGADRSGAPRPDPDLLDLHGRERRRRPLRAPALGLRLGIRRHDLE